MLPRLIQVGVTPAAGIPSLVDALLPRAAERMVRYAALAALAALVDSDGLGPRRPGPARPGPARLGPSPMRVARVGRVGPGPRGKNGRGTAREGGERPSRVLRVTRVWAWAGGRDPGHVARAAGWSWGPPLHRSFPTARPREGRASYGPECRLGGALGL